MRVMHTTVMYDVCKRIYTIRLITLWTSYTDLVVYLRKWPNRLLSHIIKPSLAPGREGWMLLLPICMYIQVTNHDLGRIGKSFQPIFVMSNALLWYALWLKNLCDIWFHLYQNRSRCSHCAVNHELRCTNAMIKMMLCFTFHYHTFYNAVYYLSTVYSACLITLYYITLWLLDISKKCPCGFS